MYTSVHTARHKKQTERISWAIAIFVFSVEWDSLPPHPFATFLVSNSFWFVAAFLQLNLFVNFLIFLSRMEMFSWCLIEVQVIYMKISSLTSCSTHTQQLNEKDWEYHTVWSDWLWLCMMSGHEWGWKSIFFAFPTEIDISIFSSPYSFIHSVIWFKKHI